MNEVIEIRQEGWDNDTLWVELTVGNICNFKCWYCFPGYNAGSIKWPDYDLLTHNLSHLLSHYLNTTPKKKFIIHLLGGEIIFWKRFNDLTKFLKENFNCVIVLTTNGSKELDWWTTAKEFLDIVHISVHHEYSKPEHVKNVADYLHNENINVEVNVFMDPFKWDVCNSIVETLKTSNNLWTINYKEVQHSFNREYTIEQDVLLNNVTARKGSQEPVFVIAPMSVEHKVTVIDSEHTTHSLGFNDLLAQRKNSFKGWECNVGVDWIAIHADGMISGICKNKLYNGESFNLFDNEFKDKFNPTVTKAICAMERCWCIFEVNMSKKKLP